MPSMRRPQYWRCCKNLWDRGHGSCGRVAARNSAHFLGGRCAVLVQRMNQIRPLMLFRMPINNCGRTTAPSRTGRRQASGRQMDALWHDKRPRRLSRFFPSPRGRGRFGHMPNMSSVYSLRGLIMNSHEQAASEVSIASNCFYRPRSSISQPGISRLADQRTRLPRRASSGFTVRRGAPRKSP
jgi:hypothetical protein